MKIVMGVRYFEPVGGAEKFSIALAEFLRDRGHEISVFAISGEPRPGIGLTLLKPPPWMPRSARDWITGGVLSRALAGVGDAVTWGEQKVWHADVLRPGGGSEREYWRMHARFDPVCRTAGAWLSALKLKRRFDLDAERRGMTSPHLKALIVNSAYTGSHLARDYPGVTGRLRVIHNGAALPGAPQPDARGELRRRMGLDPETATVLFIGHGFRRKGLEPALRAFALAAESDPPLQMLVAGRDRTGPYEHLAAHLGIRDRVVFAGERFPAADLYRASDLLLFPSYFDPFANVTVEALGYGLPVVTTRTNGGHEILRHGIDGWVVDDAGSFDALAEGVRHLMRPDRLPAARAAAHGTAERNTLDAALARVEGVLAEVGSGMSR